MNNRIRDWKSIKKIWAKKNPSMFTNESLKGLEQKEGKLGFGWDVGSHPW